MSPTRAADPHHWLNTFVGILDSAFHLSSEEEYWVAEVMRKILTTLRIPERGRPVTVPAALAMEIKGAYYTTLLGVHRHPDVVRPVRVVTDGEVAVSVESWDAALVEMLTSAYPDLSGVERLLLKQKFTELLVAIGCPQRAASFYPADVVRAWQRNG